MRARIPAPALTDEERAELARKVREVNKESEQRPR